MIPVLYLSYDGLTDPLGQSQILPYLGGLTGYDITIISFEKEDRFATGRGSVEAFCASHRLNWQPLIYHRQPPVLSTLYDLIMLRNKALSLHRKRPYKIVHCRSYVTALVGLWMKRTLGVKFIFDMRGFWADERVEGGLWNLRNPVYQWIYSFFKKKERQCVAEADVVVVLTESARRELGSWAIGRSVVVIPCCVDLRLFDPDAISKHAMEKLRADLGIDPDETVVLYLGSWGTWYLTDEILNFFTQVKIYKERSKLLLVTPDRVDLAGYSYARDVIVRTATRPEVPLMISLATASIVFIKPTYSKKASSATKLAEALAMGIPVVTNSGWGDVELFEGMEGLKVVTGPADYPDGISWMLRPRKPEAIRREAGARFSLTGGIAVYRAAYQALA